MLERILTDCRALQTSFTTTQYDNFALPLMQGQRKGNYKSLLSRPVCGMLKLMLILLILILILICSSSNNCVALIPIYMKYLRR